MSHSHTQDVNNLEMNQAGRYMSRTRASEEERTNMMQINGRKVLGPPEDWVGPPPPTICELYVRRIPRELNEQCIIKPFMRFGRIYEIRVPVDFNQHNRGYAYVKYARAEDAVCAMEVLNHFFVMTRRKFEILPSNEKNRLFVTNIPREVGETEINEKMRMLFPGMQRLYMRNPMLREPPPHVNNGTDQITDENGNDTTEKPVVVQGNRGHVFIQFASHRDAVIAKKSVTPGIVRIWDRDLKVVWANCERECELSTKTLFVRNVDLSVNNRDIMELLTQYVPRINIQKVSKVRTSAFFDFTTQDAAEQCLTKLQGTMLRGQRLDIEWAKPSEQQSLHRMRQTDFDAMLRLKCIANNWQVPVVIFGTYFEIEGYQYAAVMLRDSNHASRAIFCILQPHELADIHSRLCETVCVLIDTIGNFPDFNYVFSVQKDNAHLLGMMTHNTNTVGFVASHHVPNTLYFDLNELIDLSWAVSSLASHNEESLLMAYQQSFCSPSIANYLPNWPVWGNRIFGTIMPKYRNKPAIIQNLNDTQIALALCFTATGTNTPMASRPFISFPAHTFDSGFEGLRYTSIKLLPNAITQSRFGLSYVLSHVQFGTTEYYHPTKRAAFSPIWISCCSYMKSLKQPVPHTIRRQPMQIVYPQQGAFIPMSQQGSQPNQETVYYHGGALPQQPLAPQVPVNGGGNYTGGGSYSGGRRVVTRGCACRVCGYSGDPGGSGDAGNGGLGYGGGVIGFGYAATGGCVGFSYGGIAVTGDGGYGGIAVSGNGGYGGIAVSGDGGYGGIAVSGNGGYGGIAVSDNGGYGGIAVSGNGGYGGIAVSGDGGYGGIAVSGDGGDGGYGDMAVSGDGGYGGIAVSGEGGYGDMAVSGEGGYGDMAVSGEGGYGDIAVSGEGGYGDMAVSGDGGYGGIAVSGEGGYGDMAVSGEGGYGGIAVSGEGGYGDMAVSGEGGYGDMAVSGEGGYGDMAVSGEGGYGDMAVSGEGGYGGIAVSGEGGYGCSDIGYGDIGCSDIGCGDIGCNDIGFGDIGFGDIGFGDIGFGDIGSGDIGSGDIGSGDIGCGDIGSGNIGSGDINSSNAGGLGTAQQLSVEIPATNIGQPGILNSPTYEPIMIN